MTRRIIVGLLGIPWVLSVQAGEFNVILVPDQDISVITHVSWVMKSRVLNDPDLFNRAHSSALVNSEVADAR